MKLLLTILSVAALSTSAWAGSCPAGGCGDKDKGGDKEAAAVNVSLR